jgi:Flp pilus assembly protein TadG
VIDHRREEGAVAIIIALLLVVFMAAVALTVDAGGLYLRRRALVAGSDAASLAAARTCARGGDDTALGGFASPKEAADHEVQANAPITPEEAAAGTITLPPTCGLQWGHVTVQYTSQQSLYFAPVLGFGKSSPVTTTATASWGLGSNNPVPIVLNSQLESSCPLPPQGTITIGQVCATWYDNDTLNNGNFGFLSLNPAGWDVDPASNCAGATSGGTNTITQWIKGTKPANVAINWTDPTYVCNDDGLRKGGNANQAWDALRDLKGQVRDFPLTWEGWGAPIPSAPPQGSIYKSGDLDKYDVIGFAALKIVDVLDVNDAAGTPAHDYDCTGNVPNNGSIPAGTYSWLQLAALINGGPCSLPPSVPVDSVNSVALEGLGTPADYTYDTTGVTLNTALGSKKNVTFSLHVDAKPGPCGAIPSDNSAVCVITEWHGDTVTGDYDQNKDNITVIRLCDLAYDTCLDQ